MRLTDISVRALKAPDHGQKTYFDDTLQGFGVRVSQGGTKTFIVLHGATRQRVTIGRFPTISLSEAREEAKRLLAEKTLSRRRPKRITFERAQTEYLAECRKKNRASTVEEYTRLFTHFRFGKTQLADISRQDVKSRLAKIVGPSEALHALVAIKVFFNWAVREEYLDFNPCQGLRAERRAKARKRALSKEELSQVFAAALEEPFPYGPILCLLILSGQRRGEIAALEWEWINRGDMTITLPGRVTKNHKEHTFPFGETAGAILDNLPRIDNAQFLFPAARGHVRGKLTTTFNSWSKAKKAFDTKVSDVAPWRVHDLRRTLSTHMAPLGVAQIVVEKLLNHVSETTQSEIAQVYNVYSYLPEMQAAVKTWESYLAKLLKN